MTLAQAKKPEYFEIKKQLSRKIQKAFIKIDSYKTEIYKKIQEKNI